MSVVLRPVVGDNFYFVHKQRGMVYSMIFFKRHERKSHCAVIKRARKMSQIKMGRFLFAVLSCLIAGLME